MKYAKLFPQQFDAQSTREAVLRVGMTPEQTVSADQAASRDAHTAHHQQTQDRIAQQNANTNARRENREAQRQVFDQSALVNAAEAIA